MQQHNILSSVSIDLSIVIINYKMEELTCSFVEQELSKLTVPYKVVVVNNSATEFSNKTLCDRLEATLVENLNDDCDFSKKVFVVSSFENLGFAKGNNLGAEFVRKWLHSKYILFSNNDIEIPESTVAEALIYKMESIDEAGVIGPRVIGLDGKEQSPYPYMSFWDKMVWMYWSTLFYSKEKKRERFKFDYQQKAHEGFHYYVMGSFFMVRAEDYYQCGMMDPHTFMYAEEPILAERMKAIRKGVYFYPKTSVIHAHGSTTSKFAKSKSSDWQFESELYYFRVYQHVQLPLILLGKITRYIMKNMKNIK